MSVLSLVIFDSSIYHPTSFTCILSKSLPIFSVIIIAVCLFDEKDDPVVDGRVVEENNLGTKNEHVYSEPPATYHCGDYSFPIQQMSGGKADGGLKFAARLAS